MTRVNRDLVMVRIEYAGMRAQRDVPAAAAVATLADMFARHGITACKSDPMRGRVNATGSRVRAQFLDWNTGADMSADL